MKKNTLSDVVQTKKEYKSLGGTLACDDRKSFANYIT